MRNKAKKYSQGFTLIEVLIAVTILAIAFTAAMFLIHNDIQQTERVKMKIAANWIAMNVITKIQLGLLNSPTKEAPINGKMDMMNKSWEWQAHIVENTNRYYQRIHLTIFQHKHLITQKDGFLWWTK